MGVNMNSKLYKLMNWPDIEGIVYSDTDSPQKLLGGQICNEGFLIQTFNPHAVEMQVKVDGKSKVYAMEKVDEAGYYAVLIPGKRKQGYTLISENVDGERREYRDAYAYGMSIDAADIRMLQAGINYEAYKMLGAHCGVIDGVRGTRFAIWMPDVRRVSVVGDFCEWDGRMFQMMKHDGSCVYELFIPGVEEGSIYKYEVRTKDGRCILITDPYARAIEDDGEASVVCDENDFVWSDEKWMSLRKLEDTYRTPTSIYQTVLSESNCGYVADMGYTHVELKPVTSKRHGYYAVSQKLGGNMELKKYINTMHDMGIGVILDWECVRENFNIHEISNYYIANILMWAEEFHVDGIRFTELDKLLYLDYDMAPGEWTPNIYGGKENLAAVELFKHINSIIKKRGYADVMLIAEESAAWPRVTGNVSDGLGFDYKWNNGWMKELLDFMKLDPIYRKGHYNQLVFSMIYNYSEKFILALPDSAFEASGNSMMNMMPGSGEKKFACVKAALGYTFLHPGKKLISDAVSDADITSDDVSKVKSESKYDGKSGENEVLCSRLNDYIKELNNLYRSNPELHELDYEAEGFEWINNFSANETVVVFCRRSSDGGQLLAAVNFTPIVRKNYKIGVPYAGKCREIFNSDSARFGGAGNINPDIIRSTESECDGRDNSVRITLPPMGIAVFRCTPYTENELIEIENAKKEKEARHKREEARKLIEEAKRLEREAEDIEKKKRMVKKTGGAKSGSKKPVTAKRKTP